jgi:hypothetical protein
VKERPREADSSAVTAILRELYAAQIASQAARRYVTPGSQPGRALTEANARLETVASMLRRYALSLAPVERQRDVADLMRQDELQAGHDPADPDEHPED